jgi:RNA polymerase sigma factor (sigma-70 family)
LNQVAAIKRADQHAFVEVYNLLHQKVFYYFLKKVRLQETAKELSQLTFIKLWQCRESLSEEFTIDAQCFTIANSVLIDHLRKQALERERTVSNYIGNSLAVECSNAEVLESSNYIDVATRRLPPVRRNVFLLKMVKGYSNKEIADQLSISVKTVEDHYSKAIRHLRSVS